jgi:hypothetical protein
MKKIPTFWLALIAGGVLEGAICGLAAMFARLGPCGPSNDFTGFLLLIHLPGIWIAGGLLSAESSLQLPVIIVVTAALWSVMAFIIISIVRRFYGREKKSAA